MMNSGLKILHACVPACIWLAIQGLTGCFVIFVLPFYLSTYHLVSWLLCGVDALIFILLNVNFFTVVLMDPGYYDPNSNAEREITDDNAPRIINVNVNGKPWSVRWCPTCKFYKPVRVYHCHSCDRCIESYDHHCPLLNNCIGRRNYRYFYYLILFMVLHTFSVIGMTIYMMYKRKHSYWNFPYFVLLSVCCLCGLVLFAFLLYHTFLVIKGLTTSDYVLHRKAFQKASYINVPKIFCTSQYPNLKSKRVSFPDEDLFYLHVTNLPTFEHSGENSPKRVSLITKSFQASKSQDGTLQACLLEEEEVTST